MRTIALEKDKPTLDDVLHAAEGEGGVYLSRDGLANFAVIPLDEGDIEAIALRGNDQFMKFLSECEQRARTQPRVKLKDLRATLAKEGPSAPD